MHTYGGEWTTLHVTEHLGLECASLVSGSMLVVLLYPQRILFAVRSLLCPIVTTANIYVTCSLTFPNYYLALNKFLCASLLTVVNSHRVLLFNKCVGWCWGFSPLSFSSHMITSDISVSQMSRDAEFFLSDGVIVTGNSTAQPADTQELRGQGHLLFTQFSGCRWDRAVLQAYALLCYLLLTGK